MSHVIKTIDIIYPNRWINISSYINKVVIKHISNVPRIHMDNIIMNYVLYSIYYLTIFCYDLLIVIKLKYAFSLKIKILCNSLKWIFPTTLNVKHLASYLFCSWWFTQ